MGLGDKDELKGAAPQSPPRSLQKPALAQTQASGLSGVGRGGGLTPAFPGARLCTKWKSSTEEPHSNRRMMEQTVKCKDFPSTRSQSQLCSEQLCDPELFTQLLCVCLTKCLMTSNYSETQALVGNQCWVCSDGEEGL